MKTLEELVGQRVKWWRMKRNLSTTALGDLVDLNQAQISKIETGDSDIPISLLSKICWVLDVSLCEFFNEDEFRMKQFTDLDRLLIFAKKCNREELTLLLLLAERLSKMQSSEEVRARVSMKV
ncbi:MAG TPA: helix-turn-helix transcriptional regulator [Bacillota bacterium]|nr:helix-turn-helix transcriptional regulator [Bacillota bacterium]